MDWPPAGSLLELPELWWCLHPEAGAELDARETAKWLLWPSEDSSELAHLPASGRRTVTVLPSKLSTADNLVGKWPRLWSRHSCCWQSLGHQPVPEVTCAPCIWRGLDNIQQKKLYMLFWFLGKEGPTPLDLSFQRY